jgi:hypothetical protein
MGGCLREDGHRQRGDGRQSEAGSNPPSVALHAPSSVQISGHNIAAEYRNLAPFLISIHSSYHQIREIARFEWPAANTTSALQGTRKSNRERSTPDKLRGSSLCTPLPFPSEFSSRQAWILA